MSQKLKTIFSHFCFNKFNLMCPRFIHLLFNVLKRVSWDTQTPESPRDCNVGNFLSHSKSLQLDSCKIREIMIKRESVLPA